MPFLYVDENMLATSLLKGTQLHDLCYPQKRLRLSCHTSNDSATEDIKCCHESLSNLSFYAITIHTCLRKLKKMKKNNDDNTSCFCAEKQEMIEKMLQILPKRVGWGTGTII